MLEKIREGSQGIVAKSILGVVILSFALTGVYSYLGTNNDQVAALVNGEEISRYDLERAFQSEQSRMSAQLGETFSALLADPTYMQGLRQSVLERMVSERLLDQKAAALGIRVADGQIQQAIRAMPEFQVDGQFNNEHYQLVLRQNNLSGVQLRDMLRTDLARQQMMIGLLGSEFALPNEATTIAQLQEQQRDLSHVTVSAVPFEAQATVTENDVAAYYQDNLPQFVQPEQIQLEYVEINVADLSNQLQVDEQEAREYYNANQALYRMPERRLAAHMLFDGNDAPARAAAALARVQNGENFADVAKAESDDTFTANNGGELEWFTRGTMDPVFDDALFALDEGQVSEVLETDFGYQIVQAKQIAVSAARPFEEVQADIIATVSNSKAQQEFYALQQQLADVSFEIPDSLQETAEAVGGEVKTSVLFSRNNVPAAFNNPKLLAAAFNDAVLYDGMNSDVIELSNGHRMVVRVKEYVAAGTLPLAEVEARIKEQLIQAQASEFALASAQELLAAWQQGTAPEGVIETAEVRRFGGSDLPVEVRTELFKMPAPINAEQPSWSTVSLANGDVVVMALTQVSMPETIDNLEALQISLGQQFSQMSYQSLLASLRAEASVEYFGLNAF
ncbi:MAG: SurA N-terminal domain-containing protein [Ferrimonas sp.]